MVAIASVPQPPPSYAPQPAAPYYTTPQQPRQSRIPRLTIQAEVEGHKGIKFEHLTQLGPVQGEVGVRHGHEGYASLKDMESQSRAECAKRVIEIGGDEP